MSPRNQADKEKVTEFMKERDYRVAEHEENKVQYLRVEYGDVAGLGLAIMTELYGMNEETNMEIHTGGFDLQLEAG